MTRILKVLLQINYRHQAVNHDNNLPSTSQNLSQSPERAMVLQHPNLHDQQIRVISQTPICTNFLFQISCPAPHDSRRIPEAKPRGIPGMEQRSQERTPAALTKSKPEPCSNKARARTNASNLEKLARGRDGAITEGNRHGRATPPQDAPPNSSGAILSREEMQDWRRERSREENLSLHARRQPSSRSLPSSEHAGPPILLRNGLRRPDTQ
jgi:hypothetical protein